MHIGIAGGGLLGRLLAWRLLQAGHRVTVVDARPPGDPAGACRVAAAMLAPWSEVLKADAAVFRHGRAGLALWQQWCADLQASSGERIDCRSEGSVVVAHAADRAELQRLWQDWQHKLGEESQRPRWLDAAALAALEPALADRFREGIALPDEGCLDNERLLQVLGQTVASQGEWVVATVDRVRAGQMVMRHAVRDFDAVIDVRGFGGKPDWPALRGVRGEVLWVHAPDVALSRPVRLAHPRYQLYIAPRPGRRYVIGATEIESERETPVTVRSALELLSALYAVHPGFAEATIEQAFARCRPAFADHLPAIAASPGLLRVNGLYRHGFLLAPAVVQQVLACVDGRGAAGPWPERVTEVCQA